MSGSSLSVTDLFCGAGGSSLGMHSASKDVEVVLALNHWQLAIESHNANHPNTAHDCVDVSQTDPRRYRSTNVLWASPECTNHSIAKGRRKSQAQMELFGAIIDNPADDRSRATMFDVPRFAEFHDYDVVVVENVVDVRNWRMFDAWIHAMNSLGYEHREVYFNSMFAHLAPTAVQARSDFVPQSRDRIYIVFWKHGHPAPDLEFRPLGYCDKCETDIECVQSWKRPRRWGRYKAQYIYRCPVCAGEVVPYHYAAWNAIDWSLPSERIGDRQRPLKSRTMDRIRAGLEKYGNTWLAVDLAYGNGAVSRPLLASSLPTQTTCQSVAMVTAVDDGRSRALFDSPLPTQTARQTVAMVSPEGAMQSPFLLNYYGNGGDQSVAQDAMATLTATDRHAMVVPTPFMMDYFSNAGFQSIAQQSMATITATDHHAMVMPMPFYVGYANGDAPPHGLTEALPTLPTLNAVGLAFPSTPPAVEDCGFRMLQPHEVKVGMGFTDDYQLLGNKRDQVRLAGNAVTPPVAKMLMRRILPTFE